MLKRLPFILFYLLFLLRPIKAHAQVNVLNSFSAQQLAAKLAGPGVTILNPSLSCPIQANGIFKVVSSNLGLDSGIVLTTGLATTELGGIGVNGGAFNLASKRNNAPGDPDLDALAGQTTHDACTLEFDVIPQGDTVKFDYVFGSEEYINATCGPYNDAFAFFISGPGITGIQNMALVPGTNIPVTINSINSGIPGPGLSLANCTAMGPGSPFTSYFINNNTGTTITYEGFTTVLKAYHSVQPCSTYHLKMTIADGGNYLYDSGVFIRAGSLQATTFTVAASGGNDSVSRTAFAIKGCAPGKFKIRRQQAKATAETVKFIITGTATNGVDYVRIPDSVVIPAGGQQADVLVQGLATAVGGPKTVGILVKSPANCSGAFIADSAFLMLVDTFSIAIVTPNTVLCEGEKLKISAVGDSQLTYKWYPAIGLDSIGIASPTSSTTTSTNYILSASWPQYGCPAKKDSISVQVLPVPVISVRPIADICPHEQVQLGATVAPAYSGYFYSWSGPQQFTSTNFHPILTDVTRASNGYYVLTVTLDTSRCTATDSLLLTVAGPDSPVVHPIIFCQGKPAAPLTAGGTQLKWYQAATGGVGSSVAPIPNTENIGIQYFYVTQTVFDCESERSRLPVEIKACCDKPVFIPTAFTPNADGRNDVFAPKYTGYGYRTSRLRIYSRWGQMVFQSFNSGGWDGTVNNKEAPSDTYFYELLVSCQEGGDQQFKGDVLLIR